MKYLIICCILMILVNNNVNIKKYIKNLNYDIEELCNNEAYNYTKNYDIYHCINLNSYLYKCDNLYKYNEYMDIKKDCILKKEKTFLNGIIIVILFVIFIICM
jgi:hypothetical protein